MLDVPDFISKGMLYIYSAVRNANIPYGTYVTVKDQQNRHLKFERA